ncbi:MAG: hypothetical protein IJR88_00985 [Clostridia bacterium]|nr:hypothetical protein [Clostridia bacterium]
MKKGRVLLIGCAALLLLLVGALILRAVFQSREVPAPMEEGELLEYLSDMNEEEASSVQDLSWDPQPAETDSN